MTIEKVIERQIGFQKNMKSNSQVMKKALVEELGEFVASTGYCDWKQVPRDELNMDIELIDIAIFAINIAYYNDKVDQPLIGFSSPANEDELIDSCMSMYAKEAWIDIAYMIFSYNTELLKVLSSKQALNKLRQDYGYKTGDYIKDWNGREDNTYLSGFYGLDHDIVYDKMEHIYTTTILGSRLVNVDD